MSYENPTYHPSIFTPDAHQVSSHRRRPKKPASSIVPWDSTKGTAGLLHRQRPYTPAAGPDVTQGFQYRWPILVFDATGETDLASSFRPKEPRKKKNDRPRWLRTVTNTGCTIHG